MCGSEFYKDLPGSNNFIFKGTFYGTLVALSLSQGAVHSAVKLFCFYFLRTAVIKTSDPVLVKLCTIEYKYYINCRDSGVN